ncbi:MULTISPECIES: acyl-CoA thioesterase [Thiomicrorhabdus]|uniref:Acyl-CoA thioesterase n=1 Tax=Thiomicrorhabdus heinhorstiae TaxID=2748010 RepID=A0ABS0BZ83_9GAMM|nr:MULTISPECIES: acyl-CoA thioesterase [Thiomicrorhabdus]MBF6059111.1 acyl-CoA thioesterase [Thiomicrorhabdus heinhorstiae]
MSKQSVYRLPMESRDHECDIQGIVNNAHYQHYFEHARHRFLQEHEIEFDKLAKTGINLVVQKIEIEYFAPLKAYDVFDVTVKVNPLSRIRYQFEQEIIHRQTGKKISRALTNVIAANESFKPLKNSPLNYFLTNSDH